MIQSIRSSTLLCGLSLACFASLALADIPRAAPRAQDPTESAAGPVLELARLEDLYAQPRAHLGHIARIHFQLRSQLDSWEPFLTRFGPDDYQAFDVWSDDQPLWDKAQHDAPLATLYLRRDSEAARTLRGAPRYARFEAVLRVEQLFLGRPWIELFELNPLSDAWNEGALLHATRGIRSLSERNWNRAEDDLRRALASNLPASARADLEGRLELLAKWRDGEAEAAGGAGAGAGAEQRGGPVGSRPVGKSPRR